MPSHITMDPPIEKVLLGQGDTVELILKRKEKTKGQKRTSPVINSSLGQKAEKRCTTGDNGIQLDWGLTFAKNLLPMKQIQSSKHGENQEPKKNSNAKRQQKNVRSCVNKCMDTISSKRISSQKKPDDNLKTSCCSSIFVQDRAVQYPEIGDNAYRFIDFDPVHTLYFLLKELKDLVEKDKKTCEIFTGIEQTLSRIPVGSGKPLSEGLQTKLEAGTAQLKESGKQMKATRPHDELCTSEREKFQSLIQKQDVQLKEANDKQTDLKDHVRMLTQKLKEAEAKDESIATLRRQIENYKMSERIISDLKAELANKTELLRQSSINSQYITMERDKLLELSSCKDTLIMEYQNTIKELKNQNTRQLETLNEAYVNEGNASSQISAIHTGLACSSPTSSFSDRSNKSWHDLSDISSLKHVPRGHVILKKNASIKDSAHLELVTLLNGESSQTIMLDSYQNQVTNDKGTITQNNTSNSYPNMNTNDVTVKKFLHHSLKKSHNKENDMYQTRKFSKSRERQSTDTKNSVYHNISKIIENMSNKSIVNVPSPLRDYPHPDWRDSSLPSISTASDLDMVPSNDI